MTSIHDDLDMRPVRHDWAEPAPGTTAHRIRTAVRWALALTVSGAAVGSLMWIDLVGSTLTP